MGEFYLDDFLRVCKDVDLPSSTGMQQVSVRVLSDIELNARRDYALSESARTVNILKDKSSELYQTKIAPLSEASKESLIDVLAEARRIELAREALDIYRLNFYPDPDHPTDQELIEVRLKQQAHDQEVFQSRAKYVMDNEAAFREKMAEYPMDVIIKETQGRAVHVYASSVGSDGLVYYTVWCATHMNGDHKWRSVADVKQLHRKVIDFLYAVYQEVDAIDPWALTKSESARASDRVGADAPAG